MPLDPKTGLITEKVELPETCGTRAHWESLIIYGNCPKCEQTLGTVTEQDKVFARLNELTAKI